MPEIRLIPLDEVLSTKQLQALERGLADLGVDGVPLGEDADLDVEEVLTDDQLADFMDRLEARDLACDVYLPVEFEGKLEVGDHGVGSAYALIEALDELREELSIDEEDEEEDEEDLDLDAIEEQLRSTWRTFLRAANVCIEKEIPLHIFS